MNNNLTVNATTDYLAYLTGFQDRSQVISKNIFDVDCYSESSQLEIYRQNRKVLTTAQAMSAFDIHTFAIGKIFVLSTLKRPDYDDEGQQQGLLGFCGEMPSDFAKEFAIKIMNYTHSFMSKRQPLSISLEVVDRFDELGLSVRESEFLFFTMRGYSNKDIAMKLNLSSRTIDEYVIKVRDKLDLPNRKSIIELCVMLGLTCYLPRSLFPLI